MKKNLEHRYCIDERRQQLTELVAALPNLIDVTRSTPQVTHFTSEYEAALEQATALLAFGFNQEQLSALSRSIPDAFPRHKDWIPPLEKALDGKWQEPSWFVSVESKLQPVLRFAEVLRMLGYY